jgi:hypothetical protein
VHQVALMPARSASSSRLRPGVRRRPPAAAGHPFAMSADEFAEQPPLIRFQHGGYDTRIKFDLVTA